MPTIHKSWDLLKEKLRKIEKIAIEKRCGVDSTLVIQLEPLHFDPSIPIIKDKILRLWLDAKNDVQKSSQTPLPCSPLKNTTSQSNSQSLPNVSNPVKTTNKLTDKQPKKTPTTPETAIYQTVSPIKPKPSIPKKTIDLPPERCEPKQSPTRLPPLKTTIKLSDLSGPKATSSAADLNYKTSSKSKNRGISIKSRPKTKSSKSTRDLSPHSSSSSNVTVSTAACVGSIDALVINEFIDDEYADYDDDDDVEEETEMSKNLKKIRTTAPVAAPKPPPPPPKPPIISPPKKTTRDQPRASESPKPVLKTPPKPVEPNWIETTTQLQQNNFHSICKDFEMFKSDLKSNNVARSLLKDAVMKCLQEDETLVLLDLMSLVYENSFDEDIGFWSELVGRLKRKLSSHTQNTYKAKNDPKWIYENYKRAILGISAHAKQVNLVFTLPYSSMKLIFDPIGSLDTTAAQKQITSSSNSNHSVTQSEPVTSIPSNQNCTMTASKPEPAEPPPPLDKFIVHPGPDLKPKIKIERQENVDPTIERTVTLTKTSDGHTCFLVKRQKSTIKPAFNLRL